MVFPVIDLHCDTLLHMAGSGNLEQKAHQLSLTGLREGNVALQCFAGFVPTGIFPNFCRDFCSQTMYSHLYKKYQAMMRYHEDALFPILSAADLETAGHDGKIGVLLTIEDGGVLGKKLENVKKYHEMGVRMVTLTWNHPNAVGYPNSRDPEIMGRGLTPFGREVLREMQRLGIVVDVSHASDGVFRDVVELSEKPFIASHSNSRAICSHARNISDDMIRALADKGGVMGLNLGPEFVGGSKGTSRMEDLIRHVFHIRKVGGSGVLALGSDFDGIRGHLDEEGPQDWPKLAAALARAGLSETEIEDMWYSNARRVLREALA